MTTQVQVSAPGANQATQALNTTKAAVLGLGGSIRGLFPTLVGGGILAGAFSTNLFQLALSSLSASNALLGLRSRIDALRDPVERVGQGFLRWFLGLDLLSQLIVGGGLAIGLFLLGAGMLALAKGMQIAALWAGRLAVKWATLGLAFLFTNPIGWVILAVLALAVALYLLFTRFEGFRNGLVKWGNQWREYIINPIIQGINYLIDFLNLSNKVGNWTRDKLGIDYQNEPIPHIPLVPQFTIPENSKFYRQEGQGLFSLTPFEQSLLDNLPFIGENNTQIDNRSNANRTSQNITQNIFKTDLDDARFLNGLLDSNLQSRAQGGP